MGDSLKAGLTYKFQYTVPDDKTVPFLYPEATEFQHMPKVLATGFMVGLFEWTCIQAVRPYIDWPREQTVGIGVNLNHLAATPPGLTVTVSVELKEVNGRKLGFAIVADDGIDKISEGTHERFIIEAAKFNLKISEKAKRAAKS